MLREQWKIEMLQNVAPYWPVSTKGVKSAKKALVGKGCRCSHEQVKGWDMIQVFLKTWHLTLKLDSDHTWYLEQQSAGVHCCDSHFAQHLFALFHSHHVRTCQSISWAAAAVMSMANKADKNLHGSVNRTILWVKVSLSLLLSAYYIPSCLMVLTLANTK